MDGINIRYSKGQDLLLRHVPIPTDFSTLDYILILYFYPG